MKKRRWALAGRKTAVVLSIGLSAFTSQLQWRGEKRYPQMPEIARGFLVGFGEPAGSARVMSSFTMDEMS